MGDEDEPAVSIIWGGWRGFGKPPVGDRILTTMLMTDIAGSTDRAAQLGDAAWAQLLERHNALVRDVIELHRGQEIDTTGDGLHRLRWRLGTAGGRDIRAAVGSIGLEIHGIHTGEVEPVPGNIRGLAVHESADHGAGGRGRDSRSSTTKELVSAPGVTFEDRGRHVLKGVPGERQVYAAEISPGRPG